MIFQDIFLKNFGREKQFPITAEITQVNYRYKDDENKTPVYVTCDVKTQWGAIQNVRVAWPYPKEEKTVKPGDLCIIIFTEGMYEGAYIIGFIDQQNDKKSRTLPDSSYSDDRSGNVRRIDENGDKLSIVKGSDVKIVVG